MTYQIVIAFGFGGSFLGAFIGGYLGTRYASSTYATRAEMLELGRHLLALQDAFIVKFKIFRSIEEIER